MEVVQSHRQVIDAQARLRPLGGALTAAQEAVRLAGGRYEAGTGNQVELLDAQAALANAEANLVRAEYDLAMAWTALRRAVNGVPARFLTLEGSR